MANYCINSGNKAKNGEIYTEINGLNLHSKYNPSLEAKRFVSEKYKPEAYTIIFGYGDGYIIKEFMKIKNDEMLLVYDPIMNNIDETLISEETIFVKNISDFNKKMRQTTNVTDSINVICSINYNKIATKEYKEMLEEIKKNIKILDIDENTINLTTEYWQKNYIKNIENVLNDSSLKALEKKYELPTVVISGGPSLNKHLSLLKEYQDKVLMIAAGSTIKTLMKNNIEPDYVISIDGSPINYTHFKEYIFKNTKYVYLMSSYPDIRRHFKSVAYYAFSSTSSSSSYNHFLNLFEEKPVILDGGGSVAHYALSMANYITTGPICLIGQDLAFTNFQTHADFNSQKQIFNEQELLKNGAFYIDGYNEDKVLTNNSFNSMKLTFERMLKTSEFKNKEIFNCTEGGANIEGTSKIDFKTFLKKNAIKQKKQILFSVNEKNVTHSSVIESFKKEIKEIEKVRKKSIENIELISLNKSKMYFSDKVLNKMNSNDIFIEKILNKSSLGISLEKVNMYVLKYFKEKKDESAEEKYMRIKNKNIILYREINNVVNEGKIILSNVIESLEKGYLNE